MLGMVSSAPRSKDEMDEFWVSLTPKVLEPSLEHSTPEIERIVGLMIRLDQLGAGESPELERELEAALVPLSRGQFLAVNSVYKYRTGDHSPTVIVGRWHDD